MHGHVKTRLRWWSHLFHNKFDVVQRNTLVVWPDDEFEEVVAEHLEDHADVSAIDAADLEVVQQLDTPRPERILFITLSNLKQ